MVNWSNLPLEILETVLKDLDRADILKCQLACRSWEKACIKIAYKSVSLFQANRIDAFVRTIRASNKMHGVFVTELYLGNLFGKKADDWDPKNQFSMLVKYCPNVEILVLMPPCVPYYQQVAREMYQGNWKKLRAINPPDKPDQIPYYNSIITNIQDKVSYITIGDQTTYGPNHIRSEVSTNMISNVKNFTNLKQLNIILHTNQGITQFDETIDSSPSVADLKITLYPLTESPDLSTDSYQTVKPNTSVTTLTINQAIHTEQTLRYVMEKFTKLEILYINHKYKDPPLLTLMTQSPNYSIDFLDRFCNYVKTLTYVGVENFCAQNMGTVVHQLTSNLTESELTVPLTIHEYSDGFAYTSLSFNIIGQLRILNLHCATGDASLPFLNVLDEGGSDLRKLTVKNEGVAYPTRVRLQIDFNELVTGAYLDRLFESCGRLSHLTLEKMVMIYCREQAAINNSIRQLNLKSCFIYGPILYQLSVRLPQLRMLVIENWKNTNPDGQDKADKRLNFFIDMPYTAFECLYLRSATTPSLDLEKYFYFKLSTKLGDFYYRGNGTQIETISAAIFRLQVSSTKTLTIQVRCKSLKRLVVSGWGVFGSFIAPSQAST